MVINIVYIYSCLHDVWKHKHGSHLELQKMRGEQVIKTDGHLFWIKKQQVEFYLWNIFRWGLWSTQTLADLCSSEGSLIFFSLVTLSNLGLDRKTLVISPRDSRLASPLNPTSVLNIAIAFSGMKSCTIGKYRSHKWMLRAKATVIIWPIYLPSIEPTNHD
jgi:hypothetical protein